VKDLVLKIDKKMIAFIKKRKNNISTKIKDVIVEIVRRRTVHNKVRGRKTNTIVMIVKRKLKRNDNIHVLLNTKDKEIDQDKNNIGLIVMIDNIS